MDGERDERAAQTERTAASPTRIAPPVLIVDDEPDLRDILRTVLEEDGYTVTTAEGGAQALALLCASRTPHVVLLDHYLSGIGGREVLAALCAETADARTGGTALPLQHAIIYMSAGGASESEEFQAELAQMQVPYLRKPFDLDEVLALVAVAAARLTCTTSRGGVGPMRGPCGSVA